MIALINRVVTWEPFAGAGEHLSHVYIIQFDENQIIFDQSIGFVRTTIYKIDMAEEKSMSLQTERYASVSEIKDALKITLKNIYLAEDFPPIKQALETVKQHPVLCKWYKEAVLDSQIEV